MIWKPAIFFDRQETGKDRLNNPIYDDVETSKVDARFTEWSDEDIQLEGRDVTSNQRRLLLKTGKKPASPRVLFENQMYEITKVIDLSPRFWAVFVKMYKG